MKSKIYSLTQSDFIVNRCDWHIFVGYDETIALHCLTRQQECNIIITIIKISGAKNKVLVMYAVLGNNPSTLNPLYVSFDITFCYVNV